MTISAVAQTSVRANLRGEARGVRFQPAFGAGLIESPFSPGS